MRAASDMRRSISSFGHADIAQAEGHVLAHGHVRIERVVLEDHRDVAVAGWQGRSIDCSPMRMSPSVTGSSPAIMRSNVDFPQPDGPRKTMNSPSWICQRKVGNDLDVTKTLLDAKNVDTSH